MYVYMYILCVWSLLALFSEKKRSKERESQRKFQARLNELRTEVENGYFQKPVCAKCKEQCKCLFAKKARFAKSALYTGFLWSIYQGNDV